MTTNYDPIAEQYQRSKQQPWRTFIESFRLMQLIGDLSGEAVLDVARGEGFYSRMLRRGGATKVVGIDLSQGMIELARNQEAHGFETRPVSEWREGTPITWTFVVEGGVAFIECVK